MDVTKKVILNLAFCCAFAFSSNAQTSLNIYPLNGVIGIKFFTEKKISLEPRIDFQFVSSDGETNIFVSPELFATVNFLQEDKFHLYTGLGAGGNIYNQTQSNFGGSVPLGAAYYIGDDKRIAIAGECGIKLTASDFIKLKSYALVGIQIRL